MNQICPATSCAIIVVATLDESSKTPRVGLVISNTVYQCEYYYLGT